ncbi:MAG: glycosyltransferase family 1 protein [Myxococcales bacterium]|nr:glycosyltransferase family 1 protein [Myxococcales bacterium]MDD9966772.1 glycosyltransferase family 1 protein [Myxococcales bacterium]
MRVFINGRFLTQRVTGVQRYAHEILRALDGLVAEANAGSSPGWNVELLVPPGTPVPPLRAIVAREVGRGGGQLWEQLLLPLYARKGVLLGFAATGPLLARKQVVTVHDASVFAVPSAFSWKFRAWYKLLLPYMVHRNRRTMTVSHFSKDELVRYLRARPEKLRVSGEGWQHVAEAQPDEGIIERHGLGSGGYILAVSSISEHKNFAIVAKALERLRGQGEVKVVVAGAADDRIFGADRPEVAGQLEYLGYVTDGELRALYEHAAAFVYPSRYEGFGLPPLEAMALGCPVICSDAASMPEVCQDAVLYFRPDDDVRLAELMLRMVREPGTREAMKERARMVLEHHSWQAAAGKHLELLRELT